jgi:hypothetical protein
MDVIGFLCVSLGSSTVQLHDSLGSRLACACSEADFSSQNGDRSSACTTKEQRSVMFFFVAKELDAKDIHNEIIIVYGEKCLSCKAGNSFVEKPQTFRL